MELPDGRVVSSEEEPECTDHAGFAARIRQVTSTGPIVVAEGYQLLHDPQVGRLLTHVWLLEINKQQCHDRRSSTSRYNPNLMSRARCEEVVWPAYQRYLATCVQSFRGCILRRVQALDPLNQAQIGALVHEICSQIGAGLVTKSASPPPASPARRAMTADKATTASSPMTTASACRGKGKGKGTEKKKGAAARAVRPILIRKRITVTAEGLLRAADPGLLRPEEARLRSRISELLADMWLLRARLCGGETGVGAQVVVEEVPFDWQVPARLMALKRLETS